MQKITPFLWFDNNAEEAITFYTAIFPNSRIVELARYGEGAPAPAGTLMSATFQLECQNFITLNGGPQFTINEAISLYVSCATQAEVDALWNKLTAGGGQPGPCGWLKDRFGVSWQIIPTALPELMSDKDPEKAGRVMQAMMQMSKIDIAALRKAHAG